MRTIQWRGCVADDDAKPRVLSYVEASVKARRAGVPPRSVDALEKPQDRPALLAAKAWYADGQKSPLVMLGATGLGKTTAAAWCCLEFAKTYPWNAQPGGPKSEPLVWLEATDFVKMREWTDAGAEYSERCLKAKFLVIDDAGHEGTNTGKQALIDVLMKRCDRYSPTVLSTNMTGAEFRARYSEPLADRLRHFATIPEIGKGESLRKEARP